MNENQLLDGIYMELYSFYYLDLDPEDLEDQLQTFSLSQDASFTFATCKQPASSHMHSFHVNPI